MFYLNKCIFLLAFLCFIEGSKQFNIVRDNSSYSPHVVFKRQSCKQTQFKCRSGQCIETYQLCDGVEDCKDSSDETSAQCSKIKCPSYTFRCNYGACIDKLGECDKKQDCADNSDENTPNCPTRCQRYQFECDDGSCIAAYDKCDGKRDCKDGSDETQEACGEQKCDPMYFQCQYGACIDGLAKCDGIRDCADGSDEKDCPNSVTTSTAPTVPISGGCTLPELSYGTNYAMLKNEHLYLPPGTPVRDGTVLRFSCLNNFVLMGNPYSICIDGQFQSMPKCELTCQERISASVDMQCKQSDGKIVNCANRNGLISGTELRMECKKHFHLKFSNQKKITYCNEGTWDAHIIECEPDCGELTQSAQEYAINAQLTHIVQHPWHVGVYKHTISNNDFEYICGGNIINVKVILSAAHCFTDQNGVFFEEYTTNLVDYYIAAGKVYRDYNDKKDPHAEKRKIQQIKIPKQFKGYTLHYSHDIALLILDRDLPRNNIIRSVCLDYDFQFENLIGTVVGWGVTQTDGYIGDGTLRKLNVPFIPKDECFDKVPDDYRQFLVHDHICAGLTNGTSVCQGDSGGGLVFKRADRRHVLIGLVSNGPVKDDMCDYNSVAAYTDVRKYESFINTADKIIETV